MPTQWKLQQVKRKKNTPTSSIDVCQSSCVEEYMEYVEAEASKKAQDELPKLKSEVATTNEKLAVLVAANHPVKRDVWSLERKILKLKKKITSMEGAKGLLTLQDQARPYVELSQQQSLFREMERSTPKRKNTMEHRGIWKFCKANEERKGIFMEFLSCCVNVSPDVKFHEVDICEHCGISLRLNSKTSMLLCGKCGRTKPFMDATSNVLAYGDEVEFTTFSYKRINRFNEWLNLFQGKESTEIPRWVFEVILKELHQIGIRRGKDITIEMVEEIIKTARPQREDFRKMNEHKQLIYSRISGHPPPRMTPEQEEQARLMFLAIQGPFEKWRPTLEPNRKNFLSYAYILYKICELRGWNEFLPCFKLLKGDDKLTKQDRFWRHICYDLHWEFVSSIQNVR